LFSLNRVCVFFFLRAQVFADTNGIHQRQHAPTTNRRKRKCAVVKSALEEIIDGVAGTDLLAVMPS